jgi:7-carboxy-7-deazaguanine synthase
MGAPSRDARPIYLIELYPSIQGESTHVGRPCTFVRLAGCPLRCVWCDSAYTFGKGDKWTIGQVVARCRELAVPLVEVTGGEPLAQKYSAELIAALCDAGFEVLIETAGALPFSHLDPRAKVIADLKCPGSGEEARNRYDELAKLRAVDELKIVVAGLPDCTWALDVVCTRLAGMPATVLWSPVWGKMATRDLAAWLLATRAPGRMQIQMHKVVWPDIQRGV